MESRSFPKANSFDATLVRSKIMGPNPLKLCEELLCDASIPRGARVCDLGSGTGITSALLGCLTMATLSSSNPISNWLMSFAGANPDPAVLGGLCAGIAVLALALFAISCTVSTKVYQARDL